ncbi:MAG TPA: EamA family transporter [Actinocatenispora sp.]
MSPIRPWRLSRRCTTGLPQLIASGMLFGTGGILARFLGTTAHVSPLAVACYRLAGGGALLLAVLAVGRARWPRGAAAWRRITVLSALTAVYQSCYHTSAMVIPVGLATLITVGAIPLLVSVLQHVTRQRRMARSVVAAIGLALVGLALMLGVPPTGVGMSTMLVGAGLAALAALGFAAANVIMARPVGGLTDLAATGISFSLGGLLLAPLSLVVGRLVFLPGPAAVVTVVALAAVPTAIAYPLYYAGLRRSNATTASVLTLLEPLTGLALSVVFLGERPRPIVIVGICLLSIALVLAASASSRNENRVRDQAQGRTTPLSGTLPVDDPAVGPGC